MLAEEVHLRDWNISVFGKAEAIRETVKNFAEAESIEIHILALYESTDTVAGELHIGVDGKIDLYLVDAVTFNAQGKVTANRSYKGRGDWRTPWLYLYQHMDDPIVYRHDCNGPGSSAVWVAGNFSRDRPIDWSV